MLGRLPAVAPEHAGQEEAHGRGRGLHGERRKPPRPVALTDAHAEKRIAVDAGHDIDIDATLKVLTRLDRSRGLPDLILQLNAANGIPIADLIHQERNDSHGAPRQIQPLKTSLLLLTKT